MRQLIASALYHVRGSTPILCHTASCIATLELGLHSRATLYVGQQAQQQQHFSQRLYTSASSSSAGLWQQQPHCLWPRTTASSAYALQQCQHLLSAQQQQLQWPCSLQQQQCRQYATSEAAKRRLVAAHERRQREKELAERRSSAATPTVVEPGSSAVATPQEPDGQHVTALAPQESPPSQVQIADVVNHPALIVTRAIEWGTVILGFEQATKYTVYDQDGSVVALIAEEISGIGNELQRQLLRTRRSFRSTVLSADGTQVLFRVRRPAYLINSHMYIEDPQGEVVGEVRQRWHLWRRNYDLYINRRQFAAINGGFLAWEFELKDREGNTLALVDRNFLGFAKEIFTDAGKYVVHFGYSPQTAADMTSRTLQIRSGQSDVAVTPVAQARTDVAVIPTVTGNQLVSAQGGVTTLGLGFVSKKETNVDYMWTYRTSSYVQLQVLTITYCFRVYHICDALLLAGFA
eukprot:GHRR01018727.1.p1 GENE.GHRR01018727.1~~GHRR01018727.1.p1  ORF type:complete len:463 (+),score=113.14 GHRR01018727.1:109-1497(+)